MDDEPHQVEVEVKEEVKKTEEINLLDLWDLYMSNLSNIITLPLFTEKKQQIFQDKPYH